MLCLMFVGLTILKGLVHVFNTLQRLFPFNDDMIGFDRDYGCYRTLVL